MSLLSEKTFLLIKESFPHYRVITEHFVFYNNTKLFFDFYIPELGVVIEAQGQQHTKFVEHFHSSRSGYLTSLRRDRLKREWAYSNGIALVELFDSDFPMVSSTFIDLINRRLGFEK